MREKFQGAKTASILVFVQQYYCITAGCLHQ